MSTSPETQENAPAPAGKPSFLSGLIWWTTLLVAVMAIPLVGTSVALALTHNALAQMALFILCCWACVWAGMWLCKRADEHDKRFRK